MAWLRPKPEMILEPEPPGPALLFPVPSPGACYGALPSQCPRPQSQGPGTGRASRRSGPVRQVKGLGHNTEEGTCCQGQEGTGPAFPGSPLCVSRGPARGCYAEIQTDRGAVTGVAEQEPGKVRTGSSSFQRKWPLSTLVTLHWPKKITCSAFKGDREMLPYHSLESGDLRVFGDHSKWFP